MGGRPDLPAGTVTLVFTDIEGSTRLLHQLVHDYPRLLGEHRQLLRAAFRGQGGVEVDTQGDAFFYVFPDAAGALLAAAQAQREHAAHPWPQGLELRVRMGVHTGEPVRTEEGYVGIELHQGARVMAAGHGGQVVLSAPTATLLGAGELGDVFLVDLGEHRLKDLTEPQRLYQLAGPGLRREFPPLKTLEGHFTNLPAQPSVLIGRASELAELAEVLGGGEVRLLTLIGPGGTGKTRLALQAGADALVRFPGGVFFCELAALADPALLASTIAQAIGLEETANRTLEETVSAYIGHKSLLLLLDNFEHLVSGAPLVSRLLGACPNLVVLVTSRAPLRLRGEREYQVQALPPDEAVELFLARALAINNALVLDEAARQTAAMICARLDGLPLALELAAARVRTLPLEKLLERLRQRLGLLTGGPRDAPERQRTLRATLDWSHELLVPDEQRVFARLGVFSGGATLAAAETVCDATLDGISSLVENSLLRAATHSDGEPRYSMLETVREYALERLDERGEQEQLRRQHADFFVTLAQDAEAGLMGPEQMRWFDRLDQELANLRAVFGWLLAIGEVEPVLRAAVALWAFWETRLPSEGCRWLEAGLSGTGVASRGARAAGLLELGPARSSPRGPRASSLVP